MSYDDCNMPHLEGLKCQSIMWITVSTWLIDITRHDTSLTNLYMSVTNKWKWPDNSIWCNSLTCMMYAELALFHKDLRRYWRYFSIKIVLDHNKIALYFALPQGSYITSNREYENFKGILMSGRCSVLGELNINLIVDSAPLLSNNFIPNIAAILMHFLIFLLLLLLPIIIKSPALSI